MYIACVNKALNLIIIVTRLTDVHRPYARDACGACAFGLAPKLTVTNKETRR